MDRVHNRHICPSFVEDPILYVVAAQLAQELHTQSCVSAKHQVCTQSPTVTQSKVGSSGPQPDRHGCMQDCIARRKH